MHYRIMCRFLAVFALAGFAFWWPSMSHEQQTPAHHKDIGCQETAKPVPPTHVIVEPSPAIEQLRPTSGRGQSQSDEQPLPPFARPEWVIVYITAIYVLIAGFTLLAMKKQSNTMVRQMVFQQEALRPRLSISGFVNDVFNEARTGDWVFIKVKILNSGGMPAYGVVADTWIEFIPCVKPYKCSPNAKYARTTPFDVHTGEPTLYSVPLNRTLTDDERHQIAKAKATIYFRMKLIYKAFGEELYSDQAYVARPNEMESIAGYSNAT